MQKNLTIILVILLYSCGGDESINPSGESKFHSNDEAFLSQLVVISGIERDTLINRVTVEAVEISGEEYDRIIEMDLSDLELDNLPSSIGDLQYLEELDLSNNNFSDLPEELCEVYDNGVVLNVENNLLCDPTKITHCILDQIKVDFEKQNCTKVKYDQEMDFLLQFIRDNNLDSISTNIFDNIRWSWSETDSALTSDGKQVERIIDIKWIDYGISSIPGTIQHLEFLQQMELEANNLTSLPAELKELYRLKDLQIHDNSLIALPAFIGDLDSLVSLDIHNNQLTGLPESIGNLNKLEFLNIGNNNITLLPDTLCGLYLSGLDINIECNELDETSVPSCLINELGSQGEHPNCNEN